MDIKNLLSFVDHTCLATDATWQQIQELCDDGIKYETASVCIPPSFVKRAAEYAAGRVRICTVIGFPNGYSTAEAKAFETADAVKNGADEIDMVINVGALKEGNHEAVEQEIRAVREACTGKVLKVIIEACLLTDAEKIKMCEICANAGADYIKTSTGFSKGGATMHDVCLLSKHAPKGLLVKAAGGMSTVEDGEAFLKAGASRLGTSRIVKAIKQGEV